MDPTARHRFAADLADLLRAGRAQAALDLLAQRLLTTPDEPAWRFVMAILQQREGRPGEAAATLAALAAARPDDPAVAALTTRLDDDAGRLRREQAARQLVDDAREAAADGELEAAIARARAALAMAPESPEPHRLLAELLADSAPEAARRAAEYAVCLAAFEEPEIEPVLDEPEAPGRWAEAWRLGMAEWPGWMMLDAVALFVIALPYCLVAALPLAVWLGARSGAGTVYAREVLRQASGPLVLAALAAWLWSVLAACCYGAQRLVVMCGRMHLGRLQGRLLRVGWKRFAASWAGLSATVGLASLLAAALTASVVLSPLVPLLAPLLLFAPALMVLRREPPVRAVAQSARAVLSDYGSWVGSCAAAGLGVSVLGGLSLACPVWGIVLALRQPSLAVALLWLVLGLAAHAVFFPLAWAIAHVGSFAGLLAYRDTFGEAGFRAVPLAMVEDAADDASPAAGTTGEDGSAARPTDKGGEDRL